MGFLRHCLAKCPRNNQRSKRFPDYLHRTLDERVVSIFLFIKTQNARAQIAPQGCQVNLRRAMQEIVA
jgi:hypothetical protein